MSTELATIAAERGQSLAELMGISTSTNSEAYPSLARITQQHQPIMGEVELNGKKIKTEVIPVGTFILTQGEEKVYAPSISVRIFAQRFQLTRWNTGKKEMEKTILSNTKSGDWKDSVGGFNLGTPNRYIPKEEYDAMSEQQKDVIKTGGTGDKVNRVTVIYGTVSLLGAIDEKGDPVDSNYKDIPFVMDVKNAGSNRSISAAIKDLTIKKINPLLSTLIFTGGEDSIPNGPKFGTIEATAGQKVEFADADSDTMRNFLEYIEYTNGKILDRHNERSDRGLTREDAEIVTSILDNDYIEVDE